ncbi:MAG: cation-translocating P-type ATPase, partial [Halobacteriovoraceae bacterium]|nr:cation-translocating P-type ATPase [Halobacteriovoraceae bacterium]
GFYHFNFFVEGVHCVACLWLLEKLPDYCEGVETSKLNMSTSTLRVKVPENISLALIARKLASIGYRPHPILQDSDRDLYAKNEDRKDLIKIGVAFAAAGNIMLYSLAVYNGADGFFKYYFNLFSFMCTLPIIFFSAIPFYKNAWSSIKTKDLSIDIPIVVALITGMGMGIYSFLNDKEYFYFDTLSTLVFLLLFARYVLKKAQQKALGSEDLASFFVNKSAKRLRDNEFEEVLAKFLQLKDIVVVEQGEVIPIDGKITEGQSHINNSLLTGEVKPEKVSVGDDVYMGAKNLEQKITIEVTTELEDSRLGSILSEIEQGWSVESKISLITDKISKRFVTIIFLIATLFFVYFMVTADLELAFTRTLTLLIITCPCALALTTPLALILGLSNMAKQGVLVKNEQVIEKLATAENIFLDKTGTLTKGEFTIENVIEVKPHKQNFAILYSLEQQSHHPIATSITYYFKGQSGVELLQISEYKETPGVGVSGVFDNHFYEVRSVDQDLLISDDEFQSRVGLYCQGELVLIVELWDTLREGVADTLTGFSNEGVKTHILSGDKQQSVLYTTAKLNMDEKSIYFEKSPEEKRDIVLASKNSIMVGDGVNDAIALKAAYVGVAVKGSVDVSLRAADVYLSKTGVVHVLNLIKASKHIIKIIYRNLGFSLLYNVVGVYLAFAGQVSPLLAAILMPASSLTVLTSTLLSVKKIRKIISLN